MERNHICKKCGGIAGWDSYFQSWICTRCGNEEPKPITNADKLRAMSDEELAKWLDLLVNRAEIYGENKMWLEDTPRYYTDWLDWLKEEEQS